MNTPRPVPEFEAYLKSLPEATGEFRPWVFFNEHGDALEFYFENEDFVGERIDKVLSVFRSVKDSSRIVGCAVKGAMDLACRGIGGAAVKATMEDPSKVRLDVWLLLSAGRAEHYWSSEAATPAPPPVQDAYARLLHLCENLRFNLDDADRFKNRVEHASTGCP